MAVIRSTLDTCIIGGARGNPVHQRITLGVVSRAPMIAIGRWSCTSALRIMASGCLRTSSYWILCVILGFGLHLGVTRRIDFGFLGFGGRHVMVLTDFPNF